MSDQSQGPGWWYASDGKWYPPEQAAGATPSAAEPAPTAATPDAAGGQPQPVWDGTQWVYPPAAGAPAAAQPTAPPPGTGAPAATPNQQPYPTAPGTQSAPGASGPGMPGTPAAPATGATRGSKVPLVLAIGVFAVLLVGAGIFVVKRGDSSAAGSAPLADGAVASGADELPSKDITLGDKTVVVRGNGGKTLKSVASDGTTFTLDGGADGVDKLSEGSILLLTGVTVVKITGIERNGGDVVVKTKPAAIGEVIKDGDLNWNDVKTSAGSLSIWDSRPEDLDVSDKASRDAQAGGSGSASPDGGSGDSGSGSSGGSTGDGGSGSGDGSSGSGDSGSSTGDGGSDSGNFGPGPVTPGLLDGLPTGAIPGAFGVRGQADPVSKSGKVGDWGYSYSQTGGLDGSSTYKIGLTKEGNLLVKLDIDATVEPIISGGNLKVSGGTLDKLHLKSDKLKGTAKVNIEAGVGGEKAPVKQEIISIPVEAKYPIVVYGIPFYIGIKGKFLVEPAFSSKNTTMHAMGEVSFGGDAGLTYEGGKISAEGAMATKAEDPMKQIDGLGIGVTGMVFAAQFPRLSFGLGYGGASAGVYLAHTASIGATVGSSAGIVVCHSVSITDTVSVGAEAAFLGIDIPLGERVTAEVSKKTWDFYEPKVKACEPEGGG